MREFKETHEEMSMNNVYEFMSEFFEDWADSDTFEWQENCIEDMCNVHIIQGETYWYVSIENAIGQEICYAELQN